MRIFLFCLLFASCSRHASEDFIILAVDARRLDYSDCSSLLRTMAKHPSDGSKNSDVGHAWIYLKKGNAVFEGGHSAERGVLQPRYLEGICLLAEKGDPNPVRYLWAEQSDGYFERGDGNHRATYAVKIKIDDNEYERICSFIRNYPFDHYAITGSSCASFVSGVASVLNLQLECRQKIPLPSQIGNLSLWRNPIYSEITVASPDRLEKSLKELAATGRASPAKNWLLRQRHEPFIPRCCRTLDDLCRLPYRTARWILCW